MVIYSVVVAVTTLIAVATGRRLSTGWRVQDLVILTMGTHKLSRTLTKDAVTSPLRAPFTRYTHDPLGVDSFATHVLPLDQAPHGYEIFQKKRDGAVKVMLKP